MFEDKHMFKFVCALLGFASIIIPGPIVPIISLIISIGLLIYKIKRAKESPEGFEALMLDIVCIIIVLVIGIGLTVLRISIENDYNKYNYSSDSSQETTVSDFAETAILKYQIDNFSQFSEKGNHQSKIKKGFSTYLKNDLGINDVSIKGNKITCKYRKNTVIFTVTKNDIKYSID